MSPDEERHLVKRVIDGDGESLAILYAQHGSVSYSAALRLLRDVQDAEDVIQEMFVRLPLTLSGYDAARGTLGPWLRGVAVRLALMRLRGNRRRREVGAVEVAALRAEEALAERSWWRDALGDSARVLLGDHFDASRWRNTVAAAQQRFRACHFPNK
jgi:DNA-directed RNA polymerase specialized sigma24 family protein